VSPVIANFVPRRNVYRFEIMSHAQFMATRRVRCPNNHRFPMSCGHCSYCGTKGIPAPLPEEEMELAHPASPPPRPKFQSPPKLPLPKGPQRELNTLGDLFEDGQFPDVEKTQVLPPLTFVGKIIEYPKEPPQPTAESVISQQKAGSEFNELKAMDDVYTGCDEEKVGPNQPAPLFGTPGSGKAWNPFVRPDYEYDFVATGYCVGPPTKGNRVDYAKK